MQSLRQSVVHLNTWHTNPLVINAPWRTVVSGTTDCICGVGQPARLRLCFGQNNLVLTDDEIDTSLTDPGFHIKPNSEIILSVKAYTRHDWDLSVLLVPDLGCHLSNFGHETVH